MPKISVITPVYADIIQKGDWLDEMIQSVVSQSLVDWELLIVNDNSPISLEYIKTKWRTESRIRWFENVQNFGPAMSRNTAVGIAKLSESQAILPLDADDVLASETVLEDLFDMWLMDKTKIIYGDLQQYTRIENSGTFQRGKIFQLPKYAFSGQLSVMNLKGLMPVTALHSIECWDAAGGWKNTGELENGTKYNLSEGLEDVEYWIAAGKAGYCGLKTNILVFLYRRQKESRTQSLQHGDEKKGMEAEFTNKQQQIKNMHSDIYKGVFPMACCGGKGGSQSGQSQAQPNFGILSESEQAQIKYITTLDNYDEKDLEWVAYRGPKKANAGRVLTHSSKHLPDEYPVLGYGHVFQIHKLHHDLFSSKQRVGFEMNQPDPRQQKKPSPPQPLPQPTPQIIPVPKPQLSTIKTLDQPVAPEQISIQPAPSPEVIVEPNADQSFSAIMEYPVIIEDLGLSPKLTESLHDFSVEFLAGAIPKDLTHLPGIGAKRAKDIIAKAQELINKT